MLPEKATITTNDSGEFLGFRQKFDGSQPELSDGEKQAASDQFSEYVHEVTDPEGTEADRRNEYGTVRLQAVIDNKDVVIEIRDGEGTRSAIDISEHQEGVYAGQWVTYTEGKDGVVRRWDHELPSAVEQEVLEIPADAPLGEVLGALATAIDMSVEDEANDNLEAALGLNEQPVGPGEINQLCDTINAARAHMQARKEEAEAIRAAELGPPTLPSVLDLQTAVEGNSGTIRDVLGGRIIVHANPESGVYLEGNERDKIGYIRFDNGDRPITDVFVLRDGDDLGTTRAVMTSPYRQYRTEQVTTSLNAAQVREIARVLATDPSTHRYVEINDDLRQLFRHETHHRG